MRYKYIKELGIGAFGSVSVVLDTYIGILRARKTSQFLLQEYTLLSSLDHPNIIKVFDFYTEENQSYMIMELGESDLSCYYKEVDYLKILQGISDGINYLHSNGIIHRDIKLENIVIINEIPKIIDPGLNGTPGYIAPEIYEHSYVNYKSDLWSYGILLFNLFTGEFPTCCKIQTKKDNNLAYALTINEKIKLRKIMFENYKGNMLLEIIKDLLQENPKARVLRSPNDFILE